MPGNMHEPWLNFEAGAVSKSLEFGKVAPLSIGISKSDVTGPLSQFQVTEFNESDVLHLVRSINKASQTPIDEEQLARNFKVCWPYLDKSINDLEVSKNVTQEEPQTRSIPSDFNEIEIKIISLLISHDGRENLSPDAISQSIGEHISLTKFHLSKLYEENYIYKVLSMVDGAKYGIDDKGRKYAVDNGLL